MRKNNESNILVNEDLLGGASMYISDLKQFESTEIKWMIKSKNKSDLDIQNVSSWLEKLKNYDGNIYLLKRD